MKSNHEHPAERQSETHKSSFPVTLGRRSQPSQTGAAQTWNQQGISRQLSIVAPGFDTSTGMREVPSVIQGKFEVTFTGGIPTYLTAPMSGSGGQEQADDVRTVDLDAAFEAAEDKDAYWWEVHQILTSGRLIKPSKQELEAYLASKREELGITEPIPLFRTSAMGIEKGKEKEKPAATGRSRTRRRQYVGSEEVKPPLIDVRVENLVESLFDAGALQTSEVKQLIRGTLGDVFTTWAAGNQALDGPDLQASIQSVVDTKLAQLQKKYEGLELIDVIVIFAFSWRADRFLREAMEQAQWKNFGQWSQFANQLKTSLRKLRRFTGAELARCALKGHEGHRIEAGKPFEAHSFLSTTYDEEALKNLEEGKYKHGDTLKIFGETEGYHIEEFSEFPGEREVILLPGHRLEKSKTKPKKDDRQSLRLGDQTTE